MKNSRAETEFWHSTERGHRHVNQQVLEAIFQSPQLHHGISENAGDDQFVAPQIKMEKTKFAARHEAVEIGIPVAPDTLPLTLKGVLLHAANRQSPDKQNVMVYFGGQRGCYEKYFDQFARYTEDTIEITQQQEHVVELTAKLAIIREELATLNATEKPISQSVRNIRNNKIVDLKLQFTNLNTKIGELNASIPILEATVPYMRNCDVLMVNHRGVLDSKCIGDDGIEHHRAKDSYDLVEDGIAQVQFLLGRGTPAERITLQGHSMGGGIATMVVAHFHSLNPPKQINLINDRSFHALSYVPVLGLSSAMQGFIGRPLPLL